MDEVMARAVSFGVMPVVEIEAAEQAGALAETLLEAGLGVIEVTFRTAAAAEAIARISASYPEMLVGAGTVFRSEDLDRARDAGARFALAPGLNEAAVARARAIGMPYAPGVMTPSELQAGLSLGVSVFKFFPAEAAGGRAMLGSLAAPFAQAAPRFIPTGGITPAALAQWLDMPSVVAVGGSWIATRQAIAQGDWAAIGAAARVAVAVARRADRPD